MPDVKTKPKSNKPKTRSRPIAKDKAAMLKKRYQIEKLKHHTKDNEAATGSAAASNDAVEAVRYSAQQGAVKSVKIAGNMTRTVYRYFKSNRDEKRMNQEPFDFSGYADQEEPFDFSAFGDYAQQGQLPAHEPVLLEVNNPEHGELYSGNGEAKPTDRHRERQRNGKNGQNGYIERGKKKFINERTRATKSGGDNSVPAVSDSKDMPFLESPKKENHISSPMRVNDKAKAPKTLDRNSILHKKPNDIKTGSPFQQAKARATASTQQRAKARAFKSTQISILQESRKTARVSKTISNKLMEAAQKIKAAFMGKANIAAALSVVIVLIVIVAVIGSVIASPFGIFYSGQEQSLGAMSIASVITSIQSEYAQRLETIQSAVEHDSLEFHGAIADFTDVLAVFAVKTTTAAEGEALDVVLIDEERADLLRAVFWDMVFITYEVEIIEHTETGTDEEGNELTNTTYEKKLHIYIDSKTYDEMPAFYDFSQDQIQLLDEMMEMRPMLLSLIRNIDITDADLENILNLLPEEITAIRAAVVDKALSLVGKVNYFWGGKSSAIGWDSRWGQSTLVTATGSRTTGTYRPYGLDCSGFVTWTFINATGSVSEGNAIGHGTFNQRENCTAISWEEAQPGDLAFYPDLSHVGIVVGRDENGNVLIVHCASSPNNVVVTDTSGFSFAARPGFYNGYED